MTSKANDRNTGTIVSDEEIIERFGGIRPMAAKLGVAVTTVQGWKNRGHIPENRREEILKAAEAHDVDLGEGTDTAASAQAEPQAEQEPPPEPKPGPKPGPKPEPMPEQPSPVANTEPASSAEFPKPSPEAAARGEGPEPGRKAPGRTVTGGVGWAALALAIIAVLAVLTRPVWEPRFYPQAGGPADISGIQQSLQRLADQGKTRFDDLQERLTALEAGGGEAGKAIADRLAGIEKGMAGLQETLKSLDGSVSGLENRVTALEAARGEVPESVTTSLRQIGKDTESLRADIAALRQQLDTQQQVVADGLAGVRNDVAALDKRVAELEARPVQTGEKIAALALAVGQVEDALDAGRPYRKALDRLTTIASDDTLVQSSVYRLSQWADSGIPPFAALQRRFAEVAPSIDRALADSGGDSWLQRTWHSLTTVVTVRRVDGEGAKSPVSKAEAALADGDLAAAVAALDAAGPLGDAGSAWVEDARARLFAENELQDLYGRVIAPLAGNGKVGGKGGGK